LYSTVWLTTGGAGGLINLMVEQGDRLSQVFAALADPTRREAEERYCRLDAVLAQMDDIEPNNDTATSADTQPGAER
jgi:hypothetical protein